MKTGQPVSSRVLCSSLFAAVLSLSAAAQLNDVTQTPNAANAGIGKSYLQQIGVGQGDLRTPGSSIFLIRRDPVRSIARGRSLFQRKFTLAQGFGPRTGDGVGNIERHPSLGAGLVDSCAGCHSRPHGSAGAGGNVFTRPDSRDAPHLFGLGLVEMLADEITRDLRGCRERAIRLARAYRKPITLALRSKGISYGSLTARPDGSVDTSRVDGVDRDLRVRPFFHEGATISIREFVVGALDAEMGMEAVDPLLQRAASGGRVITPSGMVLDGSQDRIEAPPTKGANDDPDRDGVLNEVPASIVDHLEFYLLNYFKPGLGRQTALTRRGRAVMQQIGCTTCHVPDLVIWRDRRVADVATGYRASERGFNHLFADVRPLFREVADSSKFPTQKLPRGRPFVVRNIFADFKRHDLGPAFYERNFDGTIQRLFMTEPLWGVGSTSPYGHDGRSMNLREVIIRHGGEAEASKRRFVGLSAFDQLAVTEFLRSLVLFGPPDTSSNLNRGDPLQRNFPTIGHGSIKLSVLFNDPNDPE